LRARRSRRVGHKQQAQAAHAAGTELDTSSRHRRHTQQAQNWTRAAGTAQAQARTCSGLSTAVSVPLNTCIRPSTRAPASTCPFIFRCFLMGEEGPASSDMAIRWRRRALLLLRAAAACRGGCCCCFCCWCRENANLLFWTKPVVCEWGQWASKSGLGGVQGRKECELLTGVRAVPAFRKSAASASRDGSHPSPWSAQRVQTDPVLFPNVTATREGRELQTGWSFVLAVPTHLRQRWSGAVRRYPNFYNSRNELKTFNPDSNGDLSPSRGSFAI